jgi:hypothetical protein
MFSGNQKLDLRNVCVFSGGAYRFEFIWNVIDMAELTWVSSLSPKHRNKLDLPQSVMWLRSLGEGFSWRPPTTTSESVGCAVTCFGVSVPQPTGIMECFLDRSPMWWPCYHSSWCRLSALSKRYRSGMCWFFSSTPSLLVFSLCWTSFTAGGFIMFWGLTRWNWRSEAPNF